MLYSIEVSRVSMVREFRPPVRVRLLKCLVEVLRDIDGRFDGQGFFAVINGCFDRAGLLFVLLDVIVFEATDDDVCFETVSFLAVLAVGKRLDRWIRSRRQLVFALVGSD